MQRISFQLDANLAKAFEQHSKLHDCSKAVLIRNWLDSLGAVRFFRKDYTAQLTMYHFRLNEEIVKRLDHKAKSLSVTRSALLRNLIKTGLMKSKNTPWITDTYLIEKTYPQITKIVSSHVHEQTIEMLLLEARANIEIGPVNMSHIEKTLQKIKLMSQRHNGNYKILAETKLLEGEYWVMKGNLDYSLRFLNEAKMIAYANADYVLLSDIYYFLGLAQHFSMDLEGATHTYENALEYITVQDHPLRVGRVYLHLAMMSLFKRDFKTAARYLARSKKILTPQKAPHYSVSTEAVEGLFLTIQEKFEAAITKLKKAFEEYKSIQSFFGMYGVAQALGKTHMFAGHNNEATEIFRTLDIQERTLGHTFSQSDAPLFLLYLNMKENNYIEPKKIQNLTNIEKPYMKIEIEEYILACGLYINGKSKKQKQKGQKVLKNLAKKGHTELLQNSAKQTLKNKQIYPVTVI